MIPSLFVTAAGTGVGKTYLTRGLARALLLAGHRPVALKPVETGVPAGQPHDASALARACARPEAANVAGFFRAALPLAPYAVALETDAPVPSSQALAESIRAFLLLAPADAVLIEGAGGLLVPLSATETMADLAARLAVPLLIVAADRLGVLSSVLTCVESATTRQLSIAGVVLSDHGSPPDDPSPRTNRRILEQRLPVPVLTFPYSPDDDDVLAEAAQRSGLLSLLPSP